MGTTVSEPWTATLGVTPVVGRTFAPDPEVTAGDPVSHALAAGVLAAAALSTLLPAHRVMRSDPAIVLRRES